MLHLIHVAAHTINYFQVCAAVNDRQDIHRVVSYPSQLLLSSGLMKVLHTPPQINFRFEWETPACSSSCGSTAYQVKSPALYLLSHLGMPKRTRSVVPHMHSVTFIKINVCPPQESNNRKLYCPHLIYVSCIHVICLHQPQSRHGLRAIV